MSENHLSDDHDSDRAPQGREGPEPLPEPQAEAGTTPVLHLQSPAHGRRLARPEQAAAAPFTYEQRLLVLDLWLRSGLPAGDFAPLVGLSKFTL